MSKAGRAAAIDMGTNSVRLLVTDSAGAEIERLMRVTRLGQDVDKTGRLAPEAIERTLDVLREYAGRIDALGATRLRAVATSAARDASNRDDFFEPAAKILGAEPEVISGAEEARLSFRGATDGFSGLTGRSLVVDIGGGSTEFVLGETDAEQLISVDMGCVRMTERFLLHDPPLPGEIAATIDEVAEMLGEVVRGVDVDTAHRLIGVAGTVTSLAARAAGLEAHDASVTHGAVLDLADVDSLLGELASVPVEERRAMLIEPKRADVILGGIIILDVVMEAFAFDTVVVSEHDILDGLAASVRASR